MHRNSILSDSSSSFSSLSSSYGLSFTLEESSDDTPILEYVQGNEIDIMTIELHMLLRQARQEQRTSSSSRRPRKNK